MAKSTFGTAWIRKAIPVLMLFCLMVSTFVTWDGLHSLTVDAAPDGPTWYAGWIFRKPIVIDSSQVDADLVNFPVMIRLDSDADLAAKALSNGDDILFTDSTDIQLDHEIEYYSPGTLVAWVKIPLLSSSTDTTIYMYYGNSGASGLENAHGVWSNGYVMVQHLQEITGTRYNSASLLNNGSPLNGVTKSTIEIMDGADNFDGTDDYIDFGNDASLDITGAMTVEAWYYSQNTDGSNRIVSKDQIGEVGKFILWEDNNGKLRFQVADPSSTWYLATGSDVTNNVWAYAAGVYNPAVASSERVKLYKDGAEDANSTTGPTSLLSNIRNVTVGASHDNDQIWNGVIDEVRISNTSRSPEWISASYRNMKLLSTFYSVGIEEETGVNTPPTINGEAPADGSTDVSVALSELSFSVHDTQGDLIDYTVTTTPDIIGNPQNGTGIASDSTVHIPITSSPLDYSTTYTWDVQVSDPGGSALNNNYSFTFTTEDPPPTFIWWSISDPHIQTDLPGYRSLESAILDSLDGGDQGGESFAWDIATVAGDWTGNQQCPGDDDGAEIIDQWIGAGVDPNLFYGVIGNHDAGLTDNSFFEKWIDPLGQNTAYSGIDNTQRPYPVQDIGTTSTWDHYSFEVGNILFLMLGDRNEGPKPFGRECDGGSPAGRVTLETYNWWVDKVENNQDKIIVTISHQGIHDTTIYTEYYEGVAQGIHGNHSWADNIGSSMIYAIDNWTIDGKDETGNPHPLGERPYGFEKYLQDHPGAIDFWIHAHTHNNLYPGKSFNGRSDVEVKNGVTFINNGALTKAHAGPEAPFSRVFYFAENSNSVVMKTYMHSNEWVSAPEGFYGPAEQTLPLSQPFSPPPVEINQLMHETGTVDATISWNTNQHTDTRVEYGETLSFGSSVSNSICVRDHEILLAGLTADTLYYYQVESCTAFGSCVTDGPHSFTTRESGPWKDADWSYRKAIIIDHTKIDVDLNDFPVLIDIVDNDLDPVAQPDGDDIFFTDFDGANLDHEIELYQVMSPANLVAWVNVPFVSSTTDTILYMYYGNSGVGPQENPTAVWDSNYVMVQHLDETGGPHQDSTSNNNHSSDVQVANQDANGQIDGADEFDGVDDYIRVPNNSNLQFGEGSFTVDAWMMPESVPTSGGTMIANNRGTGAQGEYKGWQFKIRELNGGWHFSDSAIDDDTGNYGTYTSVNSYSFGRWYHVAMVYEADSELRFYVNGNLDGTRPFTSYGDISNSLPTAIGAAIADLGVEGTHSQFFDGIIDEVRLSNIARTEDWISAQSSNQSDPNSFYRYGSEEPLTPTAVTIASYSAAPFVNAIQLMWETVIENDLLGFNVYRSELFTGERQKLNDQIIPPQFGALPGGNFYSFLDIEVLPGVDYFYWIEIVEINNVSEIGPLSVTAPYPIYIPLVVR